MLAKFFNFAGLVIGMIGATILFKWAPPQPTFEEGAGLGLELDNVLPNGNTVREQNAEVRAQREFHHLMSRIGLALIGIAFALQAAAVFVPEHS